MLLMFFFVLLTLLAKKSVSNYSSYIEEDIARAFEQNEIVPQIIGKVPAGLLEVKFSNVVQAELGNELAPSDVKHVPTLHWNATNDALYTLAMIDPDVPTRKFPCFKEWIHWLIGNIPGSDISKGDTIAEYVSSAPPLGSEPHRYIWLVYLQSRNITFKEPVLPNTSEKSRSRFSIRNFAAKYILGNAVAGNFYLAEYDEYVPKVYKQLGTTI